LSADEAAMPAHDRVRGDQAAATQCAGFMVDEAAQLLDALRLHFIERLWALIQYRSDQVVREILEAVDAGVLEQVADKASGDERPRREGS